MTAKPIVPRTAAEHDIDQAIGFYLDEGARQAALGFIDALERTYDHIARNPAGGSPRYAQALNLPGLRSWPLARYLHIVFYIQRDDHIDIWRVLHGQRDIPAWLSTED